jgi:hypothetical protein
MPIDAPTRLWEQGPGARSPDRTHLRDQREASNDGVENPDVAGAGMRRCSTTFSNTWWVCMRAVDKPREGHAATLHYGDAFAVLVTPTGGDGVVIELIGELDVVSMERFERAVADVLEDGPGELIFDLTSSPFVSAQGYSLMGRCAAVAKVTVRSSCSLAARVLALYGHDDVVVLTDSKALHAVPR